MIKLNYFLRGFVYSAILGCACVLPNVICAKSEVRETALDRINIQQCIYPQEKLHVVTDRNVYSSGDTVWCRVFVVDAANHKQVNISKYVYLELLNPFGEVSDRIKIIEKDGVYSGYIPIDEDIYQGDYTLAAYTMYSENEGKDYFFRKPLRLLSQYSSKYVIESEFTPTVSGEVKGSFRIKSINGEKMNYNVMSWTMKDGKYKEMPDARKGFSRKFNRGKGEDIVLVRFGDYYRYVPVEYPIEKIDIVFYPEGGWLIGGKECRVAFKAIDEVGNGVSASGIVCDDADNVIAEFSTVHNGMGCVEFTPEEGNRYYAKYLGRDGEARSVEIGSPRSEAASLRYDVADDKSYFSVAGGEGLDLELVLALRGGGILASPISADAPLYINRSELPTGLYQALLVSRSDSVVMSERLFFVGADSEAPKISKVSLDSMSISLKAPAISSADCSVRILNGKILKEKVDRDIRTRLLLESELRGRIENPAYYFSDDPDAEQNLDLVMMVNGWSRYNIPEAIKGKYEEPRIPLEIGQEISGQVRSRWKGKPLKDVLIYAIAPKSNFGTFAETDAQGNFRLNGFDLPDGTSFIIRAMNLKGNNESNYDIDEEEYPSIDWLNEKPTIAMELDPAEYFKNIRWIMLDEIKVQAFNNNPDINVFHTISSYTRNAEDFSKKGITSLEQALRGIPGMSIRNGHLMYRNEKVVFFIDGTPLDMPVESSGSGSGILNEAIPGTYATSRFADNSIANVNPYNTRMLLSGAYPNRNSVNSLTGRNFTPTLDELELYIPFSSIESLDFIKSYGLGGMLWLITKTGDKNQKEKQFELKDYLPLGYQRYKEYASPLLSSDSDEYDLATHPTLLWLPRVRFDGNGHSINLKSKISPDYQIIIEGITDDGEIISEVL